MPDEITALNFLGLTGRRGLGEAIFEAVGRHLDSQGFSLSRGTIIDAGLRCAELDEE